ncbi:MAG: hypothetical protein EOL95_07210 [Bacteroidia bacterium]|nr:hypothetical protein [Bacteroidia bacterium]
MKKQEVHFVVENLIKIMNDRKLTKVGFANLIDFPEPKWNKITNGKQELKMSELSEIARKLQMKEVDIFSYPSKLVSSKEKETNLKAQITVELREELKERVLKIVFGNNNLELLK